MRRRAISSQWAGSGWSRRRAPAACPASYRSRWQRAGIEPELVYRTVEDDGGASESYRAVPTVAGVRYSFAVSLFADLGGASFIANIASFEPIESRAGIRIA
jgi:hypothetical protein